MLDQGNVRRRVADRPSHRFKTSEPEQKIRACRCSKNQRILCNKKWRKHKPWGEKGGGTLTRKGLLMKISILN